MKNNMKYLILVGDGMGDLPLETLGDKTPLEAASTPAMDFVANHGLIGQIQTVPQGFPPGSDVANLSLLGYRPEDVYTGRSPLEAASLGVEIAENEIAFRCNLVTLRHDGDRVVMVDYSGGHISSDEAGELVVAINDAVVNEKFSLYPGVSYRHLFVYRGNPAGLVTVPPHDYTGQDVTAFWKKYELQPLLMEFMKKAEQVLQKHPVNRERIRAGKPPANGVWLWGQGKAPKMSTLGQNYGISGSLISAVDLLKGIGVYAGLDIISVPGATGYLDTNYQGKVDAALAAIRDKDFVLVHVEAPDEAGHQGLLKEKIRAIEDFDGKIVRPILDEMLRRGNFRLVVCMDHLTPLSLKTHTADPVPFALFDARNPGEKNAGGFSERNGAASPLFFANGEKFFRFVLEK